MAEYLSFGEIMLRLKTPGNERFFQSQHQQHQSSIAVPGHHPWF